MNETLTELAAQEISRDTLLEKYAKGNEASIDAAPHLVDRGFVSLGVLFQEGVAADFLRRQLGQRFIHDTGRIYRSARAGQSRLRNVKSKSSRRLFRGFVARAGLALRVRRLARSLEHAGRV